MARVYILDDDPSIRDALEAVLVAEGYEVISTDAWATLSRQFAENREPCVFVADLHMPGIRGEDFARATLEFYKHVRVILYSGSADVRAAALRLGRGTVGIPKDIAPVELLGVVSRLLGAPGD